MSETIIVINAGSTSVKFGAYAVDGPGKLTLITQGEVSDMDAAPRFIAKNATGGQLAAHTFGKGHAIDHKTALHFIITWLEKNIAGMKVVAAGHRIVLGGTKFEAPVLIDAEVLDLSRLAGDHGAVAPALQRAWRLRFRRSVPRPAAGGLLRHLVPPDDARGGADLRASEGSARCRSAPLGLSRHFI